MFYSCNKVLNKNHIHVIYLYINIKYDALCVVKTSASFWGKDQWNVSMYFIHQNYQVMTVASGSTEFNLNKYILNY